jgi:hypothetical protein
MFQGLGAIFEPHLNGGNQLGGTVVEVPLQSMAYVCLSADHAVSFGNHTLVEASVFDGNGGIVGDRTQQQLILSRKESTLLIEDF